MLRNAGPTARCNAIRTNWDESKRVSEEEPYRTLGTYRNLPGLGLLFGMYYQQEQMNETDYKLICQTKLGYPTYTSCLEKNPVH